MGTHEGSCFILTLKNEYAEKWHPHFGTSFTFFGVRVYRQGVGAKSASRSVDDPLSSETFPQRTLGTKDGQTLGGSEQGVGVK